MQFAHDRSLLWLAPDQARAITPNDDEALINYAKPIVAELRANMVRVDSDFSATPFKAKISNAEQLRVHTMLVIGGRAVEAGAVSVRLYHATCCGGMLVDGSRQPVSCWIVPRHSAL